jgi:hypothetical protein
MHATATTTPTPRYHSVQSGGEKERAVFLLPSLPPPCVAHQPINLVAFRTQDSPLFSFIDDLSPIEPLKSAGLHGYHHQSPINIALSLNVLEPRIALEVVVVTEATARLRTPSGCLPAPPPRHQLVSSIRPAVRTTTPPRRATR